MVAAAVFGVAVPDTRPVFLTFVAAHVVAGLLAAVAGVVAMVSAKRPGRHPRAGRIYLWALIAVAATGSVLAGLRWPHDGHLLALGMLALALAGVGYRARRRQPPGWRHTHIVGMGGSYVVLLTAFYVDNGPNLPVWEQVPTIGLWVLPALVGTPLIVRAVWRQAGSRHR